MAHKPKLTLSSPKLLLVTDFVIATELSLNRKEVRLGSKEGSGERVSVQTGRLSEGVWAFALWFLF